MRVVIIKKNIVLEGFSLLPGAAVSKKHERSFKDIIKLELQR